MFLLLYVYVSHKTIRCLIGRRTAGSKWNTHIGYIFIIYICIHIYIYKDSIEISVVRRWLEGGGDDEKWKREMELGFFLLFFNFPVQFASLYLRCYCVCVFLVAKKFLITKASPKIRIRRFGEKENIKGSRRQKSI